MSRFFALVPAAGFGQRFESSTPKQYQLINGKPLLWHTLKTFELVPEIQKVAVVISAKDIWFDEFEWSLNKLIVFRCGGDTRALSVYNGLSELQKKYSLSLQDWLLVHDAARCCLSVALVRRLIDEVAEDEVGGLLALPVADTVKRADENGRIKQTVSRKDLWLAQTPQMFRFGLLSRALELDKDGLHTDESSAIEALGYKVRLIRGDISNFKVTYAQDAHFASVLLANKKGA